MSRDKEVGTKFTPSHNIGRRQIVQDDRGECLPTNSGVIRPDGRGRLVAEVARLGTTEVERLMYALHNGLKGSKIGVKGHKAYIDLIRDGNPNIAMTFRFPVRMLDKTLRILNSKPRKSSKANTDALAKARAAKASKRAMREQEIQARVAGA